MMRRSAILIVLFVVPNLAGSSTIDPMLSTGRAADPTAKTLSEIRASEKRQIPLEVLLKTATHFHAGDPVVVTVIVSNLFDAPLLMNTRMLVNQPRLQGELAFRITDPSGKRVNIQRLITPISIRDQDFVVLGRGESMQRTIDLADLYGIHRKGAYTLRAYYHNDVDHTSDSQKVWRGVVWSDPVEIELN